MSGNKKQSHANKQRVRVKAKDTPGVICIERSTHDEAIVISGSLTVEYADAELKSLLTEELEKAAQGIRELDGIIGHIKVAVSTTSTEIFSVTDEKAASAGAPRKTARIALAAIVFKVEPPDAESIIRKALAGVRTRLREENKGDLA